MWTVESTTSVTVAASPVTIYQWEPSCDGHQMLHYSASSGAAVRGGMLHLTWRRASDAVEWADISTDDTASTAALTFAVNMESGIGRVRATSSSGTWTVNTLVVAYERSN